MKTIRKCLTLAVAALLCATSLASCKATLEPGDNGLYDKQNKVTYSHASTVYEATALQKEYGKLEVTENESYTLYTIPGMDGTEMLATEDFNIVYASTETMPTLMEMAPTILHICSEGSSSVHEILRMEDATDIYSLVYAYTNEESVSYPASTPLRSYKVRFESTQYPGFYYTLTYVEYADELEIDGEAYGKYFLYSAFDQRFVPVSDVIHTALGLE